VFLLSLSLSLSLAKLLWRKEIGFRFTVGEAKTQNLPASRKQTNQKFRCPETTKSEAPTSRNTQPITEGKL
jgi:hypothetical protein